MTDLTATARKGFDGHNNPHLYSSPSYYAHALGRYLHDTGRSVPSEWGVAIASWATDMRFAIKHPTNKTVEFERLS